MKEKTTSTKKRFWSLVVYPDSAPGDWIERLQLKGLKVAISPLHDRDINADGSPKKPHWHTIVAYEGPTTQKNVQALSAELNGPEYVIALDHVRGMYRYFTHADNPEKAQYDENEITCINGFNVNDFLDWTASEVAEMKREVFRLIQIADIVEYADLIDLLLDSEDFDKLEMVSNHTILFNGYISSRRHKRAPNERG